jgi:16S rRNA (cytidine1402-2'-O)-methyltransferase
MGYDSDLVLEKFRAILESNQAQRGTLYIVGTPIGNVGDMSPRAIAILGTVDMVLAEDTRTSSRLLQNYGLEVFFLSFHKFNEKQRQEEILLRLEAGQSVALISDAGMPALSDPGSSLIRAVHERGMPVRVIPGPTAVATAWALAAPDDLGFSFMGFLPTKGKERNRVLKNMVSSTRPCLFYEAPHRVVKTLEDLTGMGLEQRQIFYAREMTKAYEECKWGKVGDLLDYFREFPPKGEFVLLLDKPGKKEEAREASVDFLETEDKVKKLLEEGLSTKDILAHLKGQTLMSKNDLKALIQEIKNKG